MEKFIPTIFSIISESCSLGNIYSQLFSEDSAEITVDNGDWLTTFRFRKNQFGQLVFQGTEVIK